MATDRPSVNPRPGAKTLQLWRNQAGVLHVGKNGWEAMVVYANGELIAWDKHAEGITQRELTPSEWKRVKAEMQKEKKS